MPSKKIVNKKTSSKNKKYLRLPVLPIRRSLGYLLAFVLVFSNIGMYSLASSSASTSPQIRFISFCASDTACTNGSDVHTTGNIINGWYFQRLGVTFMQGRTEVVRSTNPRSYFTGGTEEVYRKMLWELSSRGYFGNGNVKILAELNFAALSNCGVADYNGPLGITDPNIKNGLCGRTKVMNAAHEIGHMMNLYHTTDRTLMHQPLACNGANSDSCQINGSQANTLKRHQFMYITQSGAGKNQQPVVQLAPSPKPPANGK